LLVMSPEMPIPTPESLVPADPFLAKPQKANSRTRTLFQQSSQAAILLACALASYLLISHFLVQSVRVVGMSMVPTLQDSQFYLLNRWVLHFRAPHRSEIVVLRDPLDGGFAVKRVIAQSGDSVYLTDGNIYINGKKIDEPYLPAGTLTFASSRFRDQLFKCRPGQFFVLGDNRANSLDSRAYGPVSQRDILGLIIH
jgi:signal peptidase I